MYIRKFPKQVRVLWITCDPLPDLAKALGVPDIATMGGWLPALSQALVQDNDITLGISSRIVGGQSQSMSLGGVEHYTVGVPRKARKGILHPSKAMLRQYELILETFKPDLVHVHGAEWYGGLVTKDSKLECPVILSIQGLIDYHIRHLTGGLTFIELLRSRSAKEWLLCNGLWEAQAFWRKRAAVEREIIEGHRFFIGRTVWDRAHLRRLNPGASYFHCHEMVREAFYERRWELSGANRHTIFAPSGAGALKGFHVLVKALAILRREFPDVQVRVPLSRFTSPPGLRGAYARAVRGGYDNYLANLIDRLGVWGNILPLGRLTGEEMASEMTHAHVFTVNSFGENSPNSMAEALTVGTPSVVSLVGGVPSLVNDGESALGFPSGDESVLAEQIRRIFTNDELAVSLSAGARRIARPRHCMSAVVERTKAIYQAVLGGEVPGTAFLENDLPACERQIT